MVGNTAISVITPVYNSARFIEGCMENVTGQACPGAEHVIVDGGSTDGTVDIIRGYAERHPHVRWVSEKDDGQSDAMNKGIAMARGGVISVLNADDYYEPGALNRVLEIFGTMPEPGLLVGNCNVWDDNGGLLWVNRPSRMKLSELLTGDGSRFPFPINPSAYFYHRSLHRLTGPYDPDEHYLMDMDFIVKAVATAGARYVDETFGNYRYIAGTKTFEAARLGAGDARFGEFLRINRRRLPLPERLYAAFGHAAAARLMGLIGRAVSLT